MGSGLARLGSLTVAIMLQASLVAQAQPYKICIDPGHGGSDPGAVGCGLAEADITLKVGLLLEGLMAADPDLVPLMTRKTDVFVSLQGRADYANDNGVDRFASIHNNAYNGNVSGIETFCYTYGSMASFDQRDRIQAEMTATWPNLPDRGAKTAGFAVIKNTSMPATLSELAFIDFCAADALLLADPVEQLAAAAAHHTAIRESLGLEGPIGPAEKTGILRGIIYEDQGVGAADMSVRIPGTLVKALGQDGKT
ncbi:MAG: N-acetylmuramoyl-L-alanine amidase, partial [Deltaproteobacteria bacterium]|nr:N-acetylmuramoyl-L-alanine amidase [Deltaproteobacteria bacterium]